jgi:hypothetical protein
MATEVTCLGVLAVTSAARMKDNIDVKKLRVFLYQFRFTKRMVH